MAAAGLKALMPSPEFVLTDRGVYRNSTALQLTPWRNDVELTLASQRSSKHALLLGQSVADFCRKAEGRKAKAMENDGIQI